MSDFTSERSNSIIETSLTELAFIFFFILLIFSSWKINDISEELKTNSDDRHNLEQQVEELKETLRSSSEFFAMENEISPEELFDELIIGREAVQNLEIAKQELSLATSALDEILEVSSAENFDDLKQELADIEKSKELLEQSLPGEGNFSEKIQNIVRQNSDVKGQNKNLRNKIENLGNGLDHPPCWADELTGDIQYVFDVVINEGTVEVLAGWPSSRAFEATTNPNIYNVLGEYKQNTELWEKSNNLFLESKANECRHFVRIYDHAESKFAFKKYLLGVESHFYKYLRKDRYVRKDI